MMKLSLTNYKWDVPLDTRCEAGVDYEEFEAEVGPDEVFGFFDRLIRDRDSFTLQAPTVFLVFGKEGDGYWVDLDNVDLWAFAEINEAEAKAIIGMADRGEKFNHYVPTTSREWDAYSILNEEGTL